MKLKRFLSLAVSVIMVLAMIPAISASAAVSDDAVLEYAKTTTALFDMESPAPTGTSDTAVATAYPNSGITATINNGYLNVNSGPRFQSYIGSSTNGYQAENTLNLPGYGSGNDWVLVSFVTEYTNAWGDLTFYDIDGQSITAMRYGTSDSNAFNMSWGHTGWGSNSKFSGRTYTLSTTSSTNVSSGSTQVDVLMRNYDTYYTAAIYVGGSLYATGTYTDGTFNGLGAIGLARQSGNAWTRLSVSKMKIYAGNDPSSSDAATIGSALNELEVATMTKGEDITLPATATDSFDTTVDVTWTSSNEDVIAVDGTVTPVADLTTVTLTPSTTYGGATVTGKAHTVAVFPVVYTSEDKFSALGASYNVGEKVELTNEWYTRKSYIDEEGNPYIYPVTGLTEETVNGVKVTTLPGLGGAGSAGDTTVNARTSIPVTAGTAYLLRFYYGGSALANSTYAYNKVYTTAAAYVDEAAIDYVSGTANSSITTVANEWTLVEEIFVPSEGANFLTFVYSWQEAGLKLADMELYTLVKDTTVTEEIASVAEIATIKTFQGTEVVLPATVAVTGSLGSTADATIAWTEPESYNVGTTTVEGTATVQFGDAEPIEFAVSVRVMVYEVTFTLDSFTSVNGQTAADESLVKFPVAIYDEFSIEFTANYASFGDLWITLKDSSRPLYFGPEQVPLGSNASGAFRPVNGNGSGGRTVADSDKAQLQTGVDYRFFVTTDASTDKYTVSIFDKATGVEVVTVEDFGYRTNADYIDSIVSLTNNGAGEVTLSDIKVNAHVSKNGYTVSVTMNGETAVSVMEAWSAEALAATFNDIEGYEKTVSYDEEAKTVTVVYAATQTLSATFVNTNGDVIKEVSEVVEVGEVVVVSREDIFYLDADYNGYFYAIPQTVITADDNNQVYTVFEAENKYAVKYDAFVSGNEAWGTAEADASNSIFVAAGADADRAPLVDANGVTVTDGSSPSTLGASRVGFFQFPVVAVTEGQKVTANFAVRSWHSNGFSNGNTSLRFTATAINDDSWTALSNGGSYDSANAPVFEGYANPIFSNAATQADTMLVFDITEMMIAANDAGLETITLRLNSAWGAAYVADRNEAVVGGNYEGQASYLLVEDAGLVKVTETGAATLTKNGSDVNGVAYVAANDDVRLAADSDAIVVGTEDGYYMANENLNITEAVDFENTAPAALGLEMVSGAQVRIGSTELADDEKLDAQADSGLRFLATANYTDTVVADDNVEFGIMVMAEGSVNTLQVPARIFQNADDTVFTAAIINMLESNYNRKYTACAYAKVTMADGTIKTFTTDSVTRSIYQVSAGIMKNGSADADNAEYTVDGVVKSILNAYVNQTGIRLSVTEDGITVENGKYTGDVFFDVECVSDGDDGWNVTITPDTTWGTPAEIATWWRDYVRFNNNNKVAREYISGEVFNDDGVLTFNFDTTED